jgi:cell wall-associated NlpC family hydrolase
MFNHALKRAAVAGATGSLLVSGAVAAGAPAHAAPAAGTALASSTVAAAPGTSIYSATPEKAHSTKKAKKKKAVNSAALLRFAAKQKGKPYRWGATGPRAFDCSGYVLYVFKKAANRKLPRTAAQQRRHVKRIAKKDIRKGDLIFSIYGGRISHVGIYAGKGRIWHSPRSGQRVKLAKIYAKNWVAGRVS